MGQTVCILVESLTGKELGVLSGLCSMVVGAQLM